ncbi:MAG: hypothetical protein VKL59_04545 [Nostocaceae cyanobacterium]|nr:hypothetical protein [Nostocaceae cyanobacterium]
MSNDYLLPTNLDSALFHKIKNYVYQAIITLQQQQPDLLRDKYRHTPWHESNYRGALNNKLTEILSQPQDRDKLLKKFLNLLLLPAAFNTPILIELSTKIRQLNLAQSQLNNTDVAQTVDPGTNDNVVTLSTSPEARGIAVLLLDAENLQLTFPTEQFLASVCTCPIQIKIAFANWRSMGKLDVEFHGRGYDLIHVPAGKDHADGKMIAFGSSIHEHYPKAREVLVCSSDTVMTNLCNHLQKNGLTVYRVRQQGENITVVNSQNGQITHYSLEYSPEMPSVEEFINQLKTLIKSEQKNTNNQWIKLSKLSKVFQNRYKNTIKDVVEHHFPDKRARDIFIDYPNDFVVHQTSEKSELYVTLFEVQKNHRSTNSEQKAEIQSQAPTSITSTAELAQALVSIIHKLTSNSSVKYVPQETLGVELYKLYGEGITKIIKRLQFAGNFTNFLQTSSYFKLEKSGKSYRVSIAEQ